MDHLENRPNRAENEPARHLVNSSETIKFVETVHSLAAPMAGKGRLVVASFGQNPKTGIDLTPKVAQFDIGDISGMTKAILNMAAEPHRNVYVPMSIVRPETHRGKKGTESDIVAVLGLVADFDDEDAWSYESRLPVEPSMVLETSEGRFQAFILFDHPAPLDKAKPIAQRLKQAAGCDHGTADCSHVWRVPDTQNWPNKKKVDAGRTPYPQTVRVAADFFGQVHSVDSLTRALPIIEPSRPKSSGQSEFRSNNDKFDLPKGLIDLMAEPVPEGERSDRACAVIRALLEREWTDDEIISQVQKYPDGFVSRYNGNEKRLAADVSRLRGKPMNPKQDRYNGHSERQQRVEPTPAKTEKAKGEEAVVIDDFTPPFDLFGDTDLTGVPEMTRGCVPDVIEAFAWDEAERIGIDPAMIAMSAIVACAAVIDDAWMIQPKQHDTTWTENARLWLCTIAPPSAKKSPALKAATMPLDRIDARYAEENEQLQKDFDNEFKIYSKKMDAYYSARAKNEDVAEPMEPEKPPKRRIVCKDANIPSLTDILADNPSGVICIRDELAGWFSSFNNKETGDRDRADWLSAYNGGPHIVDRIKRGNVRIPNWSACLIGTIQPERLHEICGKMTADGLMQRFMLIHASASGRGLDRAPDGASINRYHALINALNELKPAHREGPIKLSPEAQADRETFLDIIDLVMALPDSPEPLKHHMGKWDGLFSRLCLTYHMIEAADRDAYPAHLVSGKTSGQVLEMIRSLLLPNLMKFYREQYAVSQKLENARWIAGYIMSSRKGKITHRDIYRSYSSKMRDDPRIIKDAMSVLDLANWVEPVDSRNGRDVTEWTVNPMVHSVFAQRAEDEKARRDAVKAKIAADAKRLKIKVKSA